MARSHALGQPILRGRESHTADLARFDERLQQVRQFDRRESGARFHEGFWDSIRDILSRCEASIGYGSLADVTRAVPKGPVDIQGLGARVGMLAPVNPLHPCRLASLLDLPVETVLTELLVAARVGLLRMRWSPECTRCGSAVVVTDTLGALPQATDCRGCGQHNEIHSLDKVMVTFTFAPDVLYVLANNYACQPSARSMQHNVAFAPMAATNTGSGFRYSVGTGVGQVGEVLPAGRYRMHCPVSMTDNFLVVERDAVASDAPHVIRYLISDMVVQDGEQARNTITAPHGRIHFDIFPDTRSFFVLWIQGDQDEEILLHLPDDERQPFTPASQVMVHPEFALFAEQVVPSGSVTLDVTEVSLVFTDIVASTQLYASLGDGEALRIVHTYFEALFGAFASRGRIVKTIGDAVMAAFPTGEAALLAAVEGLRAVHARCRHPLTGEPVRIRLGIHRGPALVIPLNGINDYFGQTVNIASRIAAAAEPSECLMSDSVLEGDEALRRFDDLLTAADLTLSREMEVLPRGATQRVKLRGLGLVTSNHADDGPSAVG